jgi:hypothetical protein
MQVAKQKSDWRAAKKNIEDLLKIHIEEVAYR